MLNQIEIIDEVLDWQEATEYLEYEWIKRCPFPDCECCCVILKCLRDWDNFASKTEDRKLTKTEILKFVSRRFEKLQLEFTLTNRDLGGRIESN